MNEEEQAKERRKSGNTDLISRQAAIDAICQLWCKTNHADCKYKSQIANGCDECEGCEEVDVLMGLPSAQPEQRCINCGRTANNGGWYKDGRTRCPIEEHYALPKDGYCHLWEKVKAWEDDYAEGG